MKEIRNKKQQSARGFAPFSLLGPKASAPLAFLARVGTRVPQAAPGARFCGYIGWGRPLTTSCPASLALGYISPAGSRLLGRDVGGSEHEYVHLWQLATPCSCMRSMYLHAHGQVHAVGSARHQPWSTCNSNGPGGPLPRRTWLPKKGLLQCNVPLARQQLQARRQRGNPEVKSYSQVV